MKKYVIQDVNDRQFYCENNEWSDNAGSALQFPDIQTAWLEAVKIHENGEWIVTVLPVIC